MKIQEIPEVEELNLKANVFNETASNKGLSFITKLSNNSKVKKIYEERDRLNQLVQDDPYEVDHHYPILGKTVCGLHTEANLVLMKKSVNKHKSNKHPDGWDD